MIVITVSVESITVRGHAYYAEKGKDIVCAAISVLVHTLVESLNALTHDDIQLEEEENGIKIVYENLSKEGALLIDSFFLGVNAVVHEYPSYVTIQALAQNVKA